MPLIAVGGQAKNIGKTTLVCNIIAAFPQVNWTAVKFSTHAHTPINSELVHRAQGVFIWRQTVAGDESDTARFLKAGAQRALFVQNAPSNHQAASTVVLKELSSATHVIAEATQMTEFLNPDLFLMLLGGSPSKGKYAHDLFAHVDAFLRTRTEGLSTDIETIARGKPIFDAQPAMLDPELASLISGLFKSSA